MPLLNFLAFAWMCLLNVAEWPHTPTLTMLRVEIRSDTERLIYLGDVFRLCRTFT